MRGAGVTRFNQVTPPLNKGIQRDPVYLGDVFCSDLAFLC